MLTEWTNLDKSVWFYSHQKHASKSHLLALLLGMVRGYVHSHQKGAGQLNGALQFHERQEHVIVSRMHNL